MKKITFFFLLIFILQFSNAQENIIYYDDFQFDTSSGFTSFVTHNPENIPITTLITRNNTIPTETLLGYTRPAVNIPRGDVRTHKSIDIKGHDSGVNFEADVWFVTEAIDISSLSNLILSFASQNRFQEGAAKPVVKMLVTTDYQDGTDPTTVTWTDITSTITNVKETFYNDGLWAFSYVDLTSYTGTAGSDRFAVAIKTEYKNEGTFSDVNNRNGRWFFSDFKFAENSTLSLNENLVDTDILVYPNPTSDKINIKNDKNRNIKSISMVNVLGQTVYKSGFKSQIPVRNLNKGIYMIKIDVAGSAQSITKKIIVN